MSTDSYQITPTFRVPTGLPKAGFRDLTIPELQSALQILLDTKPLSDQDRATATYLRAQRTYLRAEKVQIQQLCHRYKSHIPCSS